jgi:regulator of protease activity HflC (stomatin/prohibitin superfamily)
LIAVGVALAVGVLALALSLRVLREYERAVVFRLGRLLPVKGPGSRRRR